MELTINKRFLMISLDNTGGWFRVFGHGLTWRRYDNRLFFSERFGYRKYIKVFGWVVKVI